MSCCSGLSPTVGGAGDTGADEDDANRQLRVSEGALASTSGQEEHPAHRYAPCACPAHTDMVYWWHTAVYT